MIVTLNSDNPADAELIERLFAPADAKQCVDPTPADPQLTLDFAPGAEACGAAEHKVIGLNPSAAVTVPLPPFVLPEPPAAPPSVDASGLPWDARIHSESKATVSDGTWRKRRNVDAALVKQVEAELRGEAPTTADIPAPPAPAVVPPPPAPIPEAVAVPLAPAPAPARSLTDLSAAVAQGKLKMTDLIEQARLQGCADVVALTNNPLALAAVIAFYDQEGLFQ